MPATDFKLPSSNGWEQLRFRTVGAAGNPSALIFMMEYASRSWDREKLLSPQVANPEYNLVRDQELAVRNLVVSKRYIPLLIENISKWISDRVETTTVLKYDDVSFGQSLTFALGKRAGLTTNFNTTVAHVVYRSVKTLIELDMIVDETCFTIFLDGLKSLKCGCED